MKQEVAPTRKKKLMIDCLIAAVVVDILPELDGIFA